VVLASASPRRVDILCRIVREFEQLSANVDEDAIPERDPWRLAEQLAEAKAAAVARLRPDALVIGADTVVALPMPGGAYELLAKPVSPADAARMLRLLSGREHWVVTGCCLLWPSGLRVFSETSRVRFAALDDGEIEAYVAGGEPLDKAGAYAIQGGAARFSELVHGSLSNVIGLPEERLRQELAQVE